MSNWDEMRKIINAMWAEFEGRSGFDQIALAIVTIHQDVGFECYLPERIKADHIVSNYYESRWKGAEREDETREFCRLADKLMESVWFPTFRRIRAQLKSE